jgi:protein N-lysine methyltransferase METTL21A
MLDLMRQNIHLNALNDLAEASIYDWGGNTPANMPQHPDVVLAADCVYFEPAFPLLHQTLMDIIGPRTICYFCFKKRRRADMNFIKIIKKSFEVLGVEDDPDQEVYRRESIFL